jgi:hypothetical protein
MRLPEDFSLSQNAVVRKAPFAPPPPPGAEPGIEPGIYHTHVVGRRANNLLCMIREICIQPETGGYFQFVILWTLASLEYRMSPLYLF